LQDELLIIQGVGAYFCNDTEGEEEDIVCLEVTVDDIVLM